MSLNDDIENGLREMEKEMGNTRFFYNGCWFLCMKGGLSEQDMLTIGGLDSEVDLVLTVRKSVFDTTATDAATGKLISVDPPVKNKRIKIGEDEYRIERIKTDPSGVFLKYYLSCPNKGI